MNGIRRNAYLISKQETFFSPTFFGFPGIHSPSFSPMGFLVHRTTYAAFGAEFLPRDLFDLGGGTAFMILYMVFASCG